MIGRSTFRARMSLADGAVVWACAHVSQVSRARDIYIRNSFVLSVSDFECGERSPRHRAARVEFTDVVARCEAGATRRDLTMRNTQQRRQFFDAQAFPDFRPGPRVRRESWRLANADRRACTARTGVGLKGRAFAYAKLSRAVKSSVPHGAWCRRQRAPQALVL